MRLQDIQKRIVLNMAMRRIKPFALQQMRKHKVAEKTVTVEAREKKSRIRRVSAEERFKNEIAMSLRELRTEATPSRCR